MVVKTFRKYKIVIDEEAIENKLGCFDLELPKDFNSLSEKTEYYQTRLLYKHCIKIENVTEFVKQIINKNKLVCVSLISSNFFESDTLFNFLNKVSGINAVGFYPIAFKKEIPSEFGVSFPPYCCFYIEIIFDVENSVKLETLENLIIEFFKLVDCTILCKEINILSNNNMDYLLNHEFCFKNIPLLEVEYIIPQSVIKIYSFNYYKLPLYVFLFPYYNVDISKYKESLLEYSNSALENRCVLIEQRQSLLKNNNNFNYYVIYNDSKCYINKNGEIDIKNKVDPNDPNFPLLMYFLNHCMVFKEKK